MQPLNAVLRLSLEIAALVALGAWGAARDGTWGTVAMIALPLGAAALWGIFAVTGDPSRGGKPVVETPGPARICLELVFFASAAGALFDLGHASLAGLLGVLAVIHYATTMERVRWVWRARQTRRVPAARVRSGGEGVDERSVLEGRSKDST
jgi:hypothetical protein